MASILDVLAGAGNLLDLPGSSLRDILAGRNPFDQWATPFSGDNRATGRDVLQPFLGANQETGMAGWLDNPMEGFKDIAGFGAEVLLDPLNLIPAGAVSRALRGRRGARSANAAMKAERGGKYGYVNPKVAEQVMTESVPEVASDNPMKLLGYTPDRKRVHHAAATEWAPTDTHPYGSFDLNMVGSGEGSTIQGPGAYFADTEGVPRALERLMKRDMTRYELDVPPEWSDGMLTWAKPSSIADRMKQSAMLRKQREEFRNSSKFPDNTPWEEQKPFYDELFKKDAEISAIDPTYEDRVAEFYSKPIVGVPREQWLEEVGGRNQALQKLLRGLDMSQPDDAMVLNNLASAFGEGDPFAMDGPLMMTMKQFSSDIGDIESLLVDPLYSAAHFPGFLDTMKQIAVDVGEEVTPDFENFMPELLHEGPKARQDKVFKALRERLPALLDATPTSDVRHYVEQIQNVANIYDNPMSAAKFEYDRQLAKFSQGSGGGSFQDPTTAGQNVFESMTGVPPKFARMTDVQPLNDAGITGMNYPSVAKGSREYAVWNQDLLNQMRVRAINGERVPINPTTTVQQVEQRLPRAADSLLTSSMNPMALQAEPGYAAPAVAGAVYNALQAVNRHGGIQ